MTQHFPNDSFIELRMLRAKVKLWSQFREGLNKNYVKCLIENKKMKILSIDHLIPSANPKERGHVVRSHKRCKEYHHITVHNQELQ